VDELEYSYRRQARFDAAQRDVNDIIAKNDSYNRVVHELARKHSDKSGRTRAMLMAHDVGGEMQRSRDWPAGNGSGRQAGSGSGRQAGSGSGRQAGSGSGSGSSPASGVHSPKHPLSPRSEKTSTRSRPGHMSRGGSRIEQRSDAADISSASESSKSVHPHAQSFSVKTFRGEMQEFTVSPTVRGMSIHDRMTFLNEIPSGDQSKASSDSGRSGRSATSKKDTDSTSVSTPKRVSRSFVPFTGGRQISKLMLSVKIHPADHSPPEPP
jgi:hypothetical protein